MTASSSFSNFAEITAQDQADTDSTPGNDAGLRTADEDDEASVAVNPQQVDLALTKTSSTPTWDSTRGAYTATFTLTVTNNSTDDTATGVVVSDQLPAGN